MKYSTTDFLKAATTTAEHFGFRTIDRLIKDPACKNCTVELPHTILADDNICDPHGGVWTPAIANFCEAKLHAIEAPVLLYSLEQSPKTNDSSFVLNIFNVQKSIAEAILIQAARAFLAEIGQTDNVVKINSIGDSESGIRYQRELTTFLRKRIDSLSPEAREQMKVHPYLALAQLIKEDHELALRSPNPLEYLSDQSRKHFREIIEYLDMSAAPYEIDPKMIGHHDYYSDALFSIETRTDEDVPDNVLSVRGGRFDDFIFRKTKTKLPAAGVVITLKNSKPVARLPKGKPKIPSIYVVQLGFGPKMKSLMIIDDLRKAGIPVEHNLASDSLSAQLRTAEARGVRYTIIVGQKEYVDQTVILRDMHERNQEPMSVDALLKRLKKQLIIA